jgi:beta-lactam-binding protein with PASTA domain
MVRGRWVTFGLIGLVGTGTLAGCTNPPTPQQKAGPTTTTALPATTTTAPPTTTSRPGVVVPNVIGLKIAAARWDLAAVGLHPMGLNVPCNKGTLASQSVVSALAIPGRPPDVRVGIVPLSPGTQVAPGTRVGITWSGCFGGSTTAPGVVGLTFGAAVHTLHAAGLTWACYSVGRATKTEAAQPARVVLSQNPPAGTVLRPGTPVSFTMRFCPQ